MVGQTELWNTIFQHTANLVESFKYMNFIALLGHVAGKTQSRGAGANYCHLHAVGRSDVGQCCLSALALIVGGKAL